MFRQSSILRKRGDIMQRSNVWIGLLIVGCLCSLQEVVSTSKSNPWEFTGNGVLFGISVYFQ
jgi:hypothetical protein